MSQTAGVGKLLLVRQIEKMSSDQQREGSGDARRPFPWADSDSLTKALRDPLLWAAVFQSPKPRGFVKAAAKEVFRAKGIAINDGEQVGALTVKLMSSRKGRAALFQEFRKISATPEAFVAERLREELVRRQIAVPKTLYRWQGRKFFLDPVALEESPSIFEGWEPEKILLAAAPFAILQRHETPRIVELLRRDPQVAMLIDECDVEHPVEARADVSGGQVTNDATIAATESSSTSETAEEISIPSSHDDLRFDQPTSPVVDGPTTRVSSHDPVQLAFGEHSSSDESIRPAPPAPVRDPDSQIRVSPVEARDERLVALATALKTVTEATQAVQAAFGAGDIDRGLIAGEKAKRARAAVQLEYEKLRKREDVIAKDWGTEVPNPVYADLQSADSWLNELQVSLKAQEEYRQGFVRRRRESLSAEFVRVGLSPPEDLEAAQTLEHVQAIKQREQDSIALETAWKAMLASGDPEAISDLDASRRAALATRLLDLPDQSDLALRLFVTDPHVKKSAALERLVPLIREQLRKTLALPSGLWAALFERAREGLVELLDAHGITVLIPDADEAVANGGELRDVLLKTTVPVGHPLYVWTLEDRLAELTPERQIELLLEAASHTTDPLPIGLLLEALNVAGRSADAVLLASAAWRAGRLSELGFDPAREAFLRVMILSCHHGARHALLKNLLMSPEDLIRYEDGFATLVFVATHVEPTLVDTLVWRASTTFEATATKYPALINEWLLTIRAGFMAKDVIKAKESELLRTQATYSEWVHELGRKSTYTSWPYAQEYQRHIADWLKRMFAALDRTGVIEDQRDEDEVLDEIRDKNKLPKVEGQARKNMHAYIHTQRERLRMFAKVLRDHELKGSLARTLENPHRSLRSRLEFEATSAHGVIRDLYNIALREVGA